MINFALSYIDPSAGGMVLQVILGGVAATYLAVKMFWVRSLGFFGMHRTAPAAIQDDGGHEGHEESAPAPSSASANHRR